MTSLKTLAANGQAAQSSASSPKGQLGALLISSLQCRSYGGLELWLMSESESGCPTWK